MRLDVDRSDQTDFFNVFVDFRPIPPVSGPGPGGALAVGPRAASGQAPGGAWAGSGRAPGSG